MGELQVEETVAGGAGSDEELELLNVLNALARAAVIAPMSLVLYDDKEHVAGAEEIVTAWAVGRGLRLETLPVPGLRGPYFRVIRVRVLRSKVEVYCGE